MLLRMAEYTKDKHFSLGWVIGGTALMFLTNFFGGFVVVGVGIESMWTIAGIAMACYFVGGLVIGWKSEGSTILEAGLAAIFAIVIALAIKGFAIPTDPIVLGIGFGAPFLAAIIGGFIGEKIQGDVIVTKDD